MSEHALQGALNRTRLLVLLITTALLGTLVAVVVPPTTAAAAGTTLFDNTFYNNTVDGTGTVTKPTLSSGSNVACLSASGNSSTGPLLSCATPNDAQGSGKLRLTANAGSQVGGVYGGASFPTQNGLDVTFNSYQYGGGGGDGMSFVLAAVDPANPAPPTSIGPGGGSLGYSPAGSVRGLANAYLGVGLDPFGNFSNPSFQGSGCPTVTNITARVQGAVVARGPGNGLVGYCGLTTTYDGTAGSQVSLRASTRTAALVPVQVLVNPTATSFTSSTGVSVAAGTYKVVSTPIGSSAKTLTGPLPAVPTSLYPSTSWVNTDGVPKQLAFGFIGSTGSVSDFHEASNVKVLTFTQVPQLSVSTTSYVAAAPAPGDPVSYVLNASVQSGAAVSKPVTVTQTTPAGVLPLAAYGSGWVCDPPAGQTVSCTTSGSSFAAGSSLPAVNVVAIVTTTGITSSVVQNSSSTTASAVDSNSATDPTTTSGTRPAAPSGVTASPATGSKAGGNTVTVTGSSTVAPTAVEIGTTAEFQAGTVLTLLPCGAGDTTDCWVISGSSVLVYMPARSSAATVSVAFVTLGVSGLVSYVYSDKPATPGAPTATAGLTSAVLTWVAPANNNATITSYVITPYLGGVAQTPITVDPSAKTRTLNGLTAGSSYTFTVAAINSNGTSAVSASSNTVTPYAALNAPSITAVAAGDARATLTWTAPTSTGGSPVTGYVVTPYIGPTAQTPQTMSGTATTRTVTGLTPGTAYTFKVAATNASGTTVLNRLAISPTTVTATDGGADWVDNAAYRSGGSDYYGFGAIAGVDSSVPSTTPSALFSIERYGNSSANEMKYAIPVTTGTPIKVRLYFANQNGNTANVGDRVFDVALDGSTVLPSFDVVAAAGGTRIGTMREFAVTSDGTVNIDFTHTAKSDPVIYGIEIIQTGTAATGPLSAASAAVTPNANPTLTFAAPPPAAYGVAYSQQLTVNNGTAPFVWSVSAGTLPAGISLSSGGLLSGTSTAVGSSTFTVQVTDASSQSASKSVTLVVSSTLPAGPPAPTATAGLGSAVLSWSAPSANGSVITSYVITPYISGAAQTPISVDPSAKTRTLSGLTVGSSYTFTVAAVNANGTGPASPASNAVTPYAALGAPAITGVSARTGSATLSWTAPTSTGGSPITGYVVTPYIGAVAQTPQTFASTATTQTVTGLTAGTAYTFRVAAANASGTSVLYRIDTGGALVAAIDGGPDWAADDQSSNPLRTGGTGSGSSSSVYAAGQVTADSTVPSTTPNAIFDSERYDKGAAGDGAEMMWSIPVTAGTPVKVRLYFANHYSGTSTVGSRVFDVALEGTKVMPGFDPVAASGATLTGTMREFAVTSDGTINIDFAHNSSDPLINGIEIIQTGTATVGPSSSSSVAVTPNASPSLTFAAPPGAQRGVAYSQQLAVTGGTAPFTWSVTSGTLPAGITLSATGLLSGTPTTLGSSTFTVQVVDASAQTATRSVTLVVTDKPSAVAAPTATAGLTSAVLTWVAPAANGSPITSYVITPSIAGVAQPTITVDPSAKTRTLNGLTAGSSYTFTIAAVNANGAGTVSPASNAVTPYAALNAPTITAVTARTGSATLSWTAPTSTGGSPITGYVVTPSIGAVAQTPQTFASTATTQTVTGLTSGTAYTFRVAAINSSGTTVLTRLSGLETVAAIDGGPDWADNATYRSGSSAAYHPPNGAGAVDGTVPSTTPLGLFFTERWANDRNNPLKYAIPVTSGVPVVVRLYFANTYPGTGTVGTRDFDVALEGATVLPGFDPVAAAGGPLIGTMRDFAVTSDGTVNIDLNYGQRDTPAIYGIEIIQTGVTTNGPPSSASTAVTPNASPTLTFTGVPAGEVGVAYSSQLPVSGGTAPFTWSVTSGSLPAGLSLSSAGLLTGTPTAAGSSTYTVQVTDASGQSASKPVTQVIAAAPSLSFTPAAGEVGVAYSQQPTLTGGTSPFTWSISAGSLPAGLSIDTATGLVSGTPTASGSFSVTVRVVDAFNQVANRTANLVIAPLPTLTSAPPKQYQQAGFGFTFAATGGTGPFTYAVVSGSLPPGLNLSSVGGLTGQTNQGSYTFTVRATDAKGQTADDPVTLVVDAPPVQVVKTASTTSVAPGGTVTFTVTATNISSTYYGNTHVYDPLADVVDDAAYNSNATVTLGSVSYSGSTLDWAIPLNAGQSATLTYTVTVANPDTGNKLLTGQVSGVFSSTSCSSGQQTSACTAPVTVSGLSVSTTANVATTTPGSAVTFTTVVTNTGQTPYAAATVSQSLAALLDDATYNGGATTTTGGLAYASSTLTWTGALAVGASATITYTVTVANPDAGDRSLPVTAVSSAAGSTCPSGNPGPACSAVVTVLIPALSITHTSSVTSTTPGGSVAYTVVLANTGQTPYTATSVSLDLTGVLDDATIAGGSATSGSLSYSAGTTVWTGDIAVGATVTISGSVTVANPDTGDKVLSTVVTSAAAGSTCPVGGTSSACRTTVQVLVPALTITASSDVATTTPGSVVRYSVLVTNTGQTPYTGAAFSTSLTGVLDDATFNGDLTASVGSASYAGSTVSWTGDLAVGASATVSYGVTVRAPDPGNLALTSTVVSTTTGNSCPSGSSAAGCTVTVPVLIPSLSLSTVADAGATTTPGATVRYTTTVLNSGQTTYTGLLVVLDQRGVFDDATFNLDGVESSGTATPASDSTLHWVLSLAPGQSATATATFRVNDPATGDKQMTGNVTSSAAGSSCPTPSAASSCRTSVTVLIPGLTLSTSASPTSVTPADVVSYTIVATNTGQTGYGAVTVTDDLTGVLGDAVYAGGATATSGGTPTFAGSSLSWTGPLALGASTTISFTVTVRDPDPGNKRLANTVVSNAAGSNCAAGSNDSRCSSAVTVLVPGLTITKSADVATTVPGARVTYTVTVSNSGATAYTAATFSDPLGGVLDDADYAGDATVASGGGTVGYASSAVSWSGALAVGASATVTYSVTVHAADGGDNRLTNTVTSTSRGNSCPAGGSDPRCTVTVPVARLVLVETATESTTTPGSVVHVSTTWTNTGQVPYVGISVVSPRADTADDTTPTGDQTTSSGTLTRTSDAVTWSGDIAVGGVVTGARTLVVKNPDPGNKLITATLQSSAPGNNCPSGTADPRCTFAVTVLVPGLSISKVANTPATVPGGTVSYTITAHNTGQTSYAAAALTDSLTGVLDDATYNGDATADSGTLSYAAPTLGWTGALALDQTVTITYTVTVKAQPGDKTLVNPVTSDAIGNNCPAASGDPACRSTVVVLTPGLTLAKTADVANATLGSTVTYTVQVTNSGQTPYASASFSDSLAGVLDDATYNGDAASTPTGTVGYAGSTLSWSGALAPGASATVTYSVTIRNPSPGDRNLTNTIVSTSTGSNCPTGSSDSRCTVAVAVTNAVSLTLTKTADVLVTAAGKQVHYTVTAVNSSALSLAANFTDELAGVLDDATYDANPVASSGNVTRVGSTLLWIGTVPAHGTVIVTYSVTVHSPATGNQILASQLTSTSPPVSNNCLAGSTDPRCISTVPVAALVIQASYAELTTTPGSVLHLTVTFTNTGQAAYHGITIFSPFGGITDDALGTGDQVASSGSLAYTETAATWTGDIPIGATITITSTLTVLDPDLGDQRVTHTVETAALGSNCPSGGSDPRCTSLSVVQVPQLSLTSTADQTAVVPGAQVGYTLTIRDTGETGYTGATVTAALAGVLDDAAYDGNAVASSGAVAFDGTPGGQGLTWTGDLVVGQTVTITYSVTARQPATGDKSMVTRVSSTAVGSTCPPGGTGSACSTTVNVLTPALTLSTAASASTTVPGAAVTFSVTATNSGQTDYPAGTQIVLPLVGITDDAAYAGGATSSSGAVALGGGGLTWTGAVAMGATVTITYSVTVNDPVTGDHLLAASVRSAAQGSNCAASTTDPRCAVSVPVASLHMSDVTNVSVAQPTTVVRFTETYTNTGQVPYYGLDVTIDGRDVFDDATYNGDATPSAGSLTLDANTGLLTWTGDLAVGASVTTTGSVTVNNPTLGNKHLRTRISTTDTPSNCAPGSTDPVCVIDVPVLTPGLSIVQTADTATTTPGSVVGYTLTITNAGQTSYTGTSVTTDLSGLLDDAQLQAGAQASTGQLLQSGSTLTWTGDLGLGQVATITYGARVRNPDPGDLTMVGRVSSDAIGSSCPSAGSAPSCSSLVIVLIPALDITVTPSSTTTYPGGQVGYTLTIRNTGQAPYAGASVSAGLAGALDDATYANDGQANVGTVGFGEGVVTWTGDLAVNQTAVVTYSVMVRDPDPGNRVLLTSVSSTTPGSTCTADQPCTSSVVVQIPGLSVSTTADATTATPGGRVRFTVTVTNSGERPYVGTVTTMSLSDVLDDATFDGTVTASSGLASYTAPDISWTGDLAVGAQVSVSYTVTVRDPTTGNKTMSATALNASAGSPCRAGSPSPACTATVQVLVPSLTLTVSGDTPTTTPGSVVRYTILVTNNGEAPYVGAVVTDDLAGVLPDAGYNDDARVVGGGALAYGSSGLTWTGNLAVGATATITFSVTVHDPDTGDRVLLSAVSSAAQGSRCPSGSTASGCVSSVQVLVPGLLVSTAADRATVVAGSPVAYTLTLQNTGETAYAPATASWSLAGVLDDGTYPGDVVATSGTVERTGNTLAWSGALALGQTVTITYSIGTAFPATGDRSLDTAVRSTSAGSTCVAGTEAGCATHVAVLVPALTVTKTASTTHVVPRGRVGYTLTAKNTGEAAYPAAALADDLSGVLDHATYAGDATATTGTVGVAGSTLTWSGGLGVGDSVVITYSVVVNTVVADPAALVNRVSSTAVGSTCPVGNGSGACGTSTVIDPSTLELRDLTTSFTLSGIPGSTVSLDDAVVGTVVTNSIGGYSVSVRAVSVTLDGQDSANHDTIPVADLAVRPNGSAPYTALSTSTAIPVYSQDHASAPNGDAVSTDYQVQIPFVASGTYTVTVEYVVTSQ